MCLLYREWDGFTVFWSADPPSCLGERQSLTPRRTWQRRSPATCLPPRAQHGTQWWRSGDCTIWTKHIKTPLDNKKNSQTVLSFSCQTDQLWYHKSYFYTRITHVCIIYMYHEMNVKTSVIVNWSISQNSDLPGPQRQAPRPRNCGVRGIRPARGGARGGHGCDRCDTDAGGGWKPSGFSFATFVVQGTSRNVRYVSGGSEEVEKKRKTCSFNLQANLNHGIQLWCFHPIIY